MTKFRKKPVVIEAEQFQLGQEPYPEGVVAVLISRDDPNVCLGPHDPKIEPDAMNANLGFGIKTPEGYHVVTHCDWIITGIKGEKYPCKPDIFEATYNPVEES